MGSDMTVESQPTAQPMPALYLGHGAPPLLEDAAWMAEFKAWTDALPRP
jgi:4,5-DOPA dioxygenase extradiol